MKKIFGVAATLAVLSAAAASSAFAQCGTGVMIKFDADAFAYETAYNNATYISSPGSQLSIVGITDLFCTPLNFLNALDPSTEYTFYCTGLTSGGTIVTPVGPTTFYQTAYSGGTWAIYAGSPRNAPTAAGGMPALPSPQVPGNFIDGTLILSGTFSGFSTTVTVNGANINGSFNSNYMATGGLYFPLIGNGSALFAGNWCVTSAPAGCVPATYSAHPNGKWDTPSTTAALPSTWGRLKTLYR
jgi:hypothetical protein